MCGEHPRLDVKSHVETGSSPRVRGTLNDAGIWHLAFGIIPACAGNTGLARCRPRARRDHPRVCGEHESLIIELVVVEGSSPRVRGTPEDPREIPRFPGIIPACAGNTALSDSRRKTSRDHPRVCGEHRLGRMRRRYIRGSSPRVRGTPATVEFDTGMWGIIPACAGNTVSLAQVE